MKNEEQNNSKPLPSDEEFHPFVLGALLNDINIVRQYLDAQTAPDCISNGVTPLWVAAQEGNYEIADLLIQAGADVNFKDPIGQSVLWTAALNGHFMLVRLLISKGARVNDTANHVSPLWVAVQNNYLDTVRELLHAQCDVNLSYEFLNQSPLFKASLLGFDAIVFELINANADVNFADRSGATPLMAASQNGHLNCVKMLIDAGAKVRAKNKTGETALSFAHLGNASSVASYLIQAGAEVDLSFCRMDQQFINYLSVIAKIFPEKYNLEDIATIKEVISSGLCYGYSILLVALPESSWAGFYDDQRYLSKWDGSEDTLRNDKKLQDLFEELIGTLLWLHRRHGLLANGELEKVESLINVISKNQKEEIFNFCFLLKANEIENILQIILEPGKKIEICSVSQNSHSILLTKSPTGEYILCNDNSAVGPIALHSLKEIVETIYLMFGDDVGYGNPMGIGFTVYDSSHSPDKKRYAEYKSKIVDSIIAVRLEHNELNLFNSSKIGALNCAVYLDDEETVLKLLKNGAVINYEAEYYMLPVYMAAYHGNVRILDQLTQHLKGLDLDGNSTEGFPLLVAAAYGRTSAIRFLINHEVKKNRGESEGITPLMVAAQNGHLESVIALVQGGTDVNYLSTDGRSALFIACKYGHFKIVEYLAQHGADTDPNSYFVRPIDAAIANGHLNVVERLAKLGVNFSLKNSKGLSPLTLAEAASQPKIVDYIKSQLPQNPGKSTHTLFGNNQPTQPEENSYRMVFMDPVVRTHFQ
jgi:ankyrin repeat protein